MNLIAYEILMHMNYCFNEYMSYSLHIPRLHWPLFCLVIFWPRRLLQGSELGSKFPCESFLQQLTPELKGWVAGQLRVLLPVTVLRGGARGAPLRCATHTWLQSSKPVSWAHIYFSLLWEWLLPSTLMASHFNLNTQPKCIQMMEKGVLTVYEAPSA